MGGGFGEVLLGISNTQLFEFPRQATKCERFLVALQVIV